MYGFVKPYSFGSPAPRNINAGIARPMGAQFGGSMYGPPTTPYKGEKHAPQKLPGSRLRIAPGNYTGPGTHVVERLKRGDKPVSATDMVSQAHDLRYSIAETKEDVRRADEIMVKTLKRIRKSGGDSKFNTIPAQKAIELKMKGENVGLFKPTTFTTFGTDGIPEEDVALMRRKLTELEQKGFGHSKYVKKKRKRHIKTQCQQMKGYGLKLAGQKGGFLPFLLPFMPAIIAAGKAMAIGAAGAAGAHAYNAATGQSGKGWVDDVKTRFKLTMDDFSQAALKKMNALAKKYSEPEQVQILMDKLKPYIQKAVKSGMKSMGMSGRGLSLAGAGGASYHSAFIAKHPAQNGQGFLSDAVKWGKTKYNQVKSLVDKLPIAEGKLVKSVLQQVREDPDILENKEFWKQLGTRLTPTGKRALNSLFKKYKIPVSVS